MNKNAISKFVQESVEWLVENQMGCCRYKLDDHLAIFVGWSAGYGNEPRKDVIQAKDNLDYAINVGIKVWTSDDMWTDYDYLNFPYQENGFVYQFDLAIGPNDSYEHIAEIMMRWYGYVEEFDMNDSGLIFEREVEYDVVCFERTLKINFSKGGNIDKDEIWKALDKYYDEWQEDDQGRCCEEFMIDSVCEEFDITVEDWDSIPYEGKEEREHLWVCDHCLSAIWSREGNQATLAHYVDEMDAIESRCDWCKQVGFDTLYELV